MTEARVVTAICRFFFLALLDEQAALSASIKAMNDWRTRSLKSNSLSQEAPILLVQSLAKAWSQFKQIPQSGQPMVFSEKEWILPQQLDLGAWLEFRRAGRPDEFFVVLMVSVLRIPVEAVAAGLKETEGTIRHRLARGLRQLGLIQTVPQEVRL